MIAFDIRTAYLIIGLLYVALPTFTWVVLATPRRSAVAFWCGGGLLTGAAFVLLGLRGSAPDLLSHTGSHLLLMVGILMHVHALRLDLGMARRNRWMAAGTLAFTLCYEAIRQGVQDDALRLQLFYVLYLVWSWLLLHISALARRISKAENSRSAQWISQCYLLVVGALVLRQLHVFTGISGASSLASGLDMQVVGVSLVLASVVGNIGYVGLALDRSMRRTVNAATARARDEVSRRLDAQIAQLDRQRVLGTMSSSLGHELTQPLSAILLSAGIARRGVLAGHVDAAKLAEFLDIIVDSTRRASKIIERIRNFIRPSELRREPVDLGRVVHDVTALVADEAKSCKLAISCTLLTQPLWVAGDAIQIAQVVLNVFRNAMEAMTVVDRREIHVTLLRRGSRAVMRIRDSGPGLAPEAVALAGTAFFTTKAAGLGLGLSISRSILKQFEGTFSIKNAAEGGALVELDWPALGSDA